MAFAKGRVSLTADYYHKKTNDLLLERPISGTVGFTTVFDNVGSVRTRGRAGLTTVNTDSRKADGFRWTTTLNLALNRNKVTALFNDQPFNGGHPRASTGSRSAQPLGAFHTLHFLGVDPATGDAIFEDVDGDGAITSTTRQSSAIALARLHRRAHQHLYVQGIRSDRASSSSARATTSSTPCGSSPTTAAATFDNQFSNVRTSWRKPGDSPTCPGPVTTALSGADIISSRFVEDGSYWRMQDLTLGTGCRSASPGGSASPLAPVSVGPQPVHDHRLHRLLAGCEQQRRQQERRPGDVESFYDSYACQARTLDLRRPGRLVMPPRPLYGAPRCEFDLLSPSRCWPGWPAATRFSTRARPTSFPTTGDHRAPRARGRR